MRCLSAVDRDCESRAMVMLLVCGVFVFDWKHFFLSVDEKASVKSSTYLNQENDHE